VALLTPARDTVVGHNCVRSLRSRGEKWKKQRDSEEKHYNYRHNFYEQAFNKANH
jgi:hypothetical protein